MRKEFLTLTLDRDTYTLLSKLAEESRLSRAAYVRTLLVQQTNPQAGPAIVNATTGRDRLVNKHGRWVKFSELSPLEQLATSVAQQAGITIDTAKWKSDLKEPFTRKHTKEKPDS